MSQNRNFPAAAQSIKLQNYLEEHTHALETLVEASGQSLTAEVVHKFRVALLRVRTVFWLLNGNSTARHIGNRLKGFQRLNRKLGKLRELDVALSDARIYSLASTDLILKRNKLRRQLQNYLTPGRRQALLTELREAGETIDQVSKLKLKKPLKNLIKRTKSWARHPNRRDEHLHQFRIDMKKVRYTLESHQLPVKPLRNLQNALGRAHDLEILRRYVGKNLQSAQDAAHLRKKIEKIAPAVLRIAKRELKSIRSP